MKLLEILVQFLKEKFLKKISQLWEKENSSVIFQI